MRSRMRLALAPLLLALTGCAGAAPPLTVAPRDACALGNSPFRDAGSTHGPAAASAPGHFADVLPRRVEGERARIEAEPGPKLPAQPLEIARLACPVADHARAHEAARALDADVVIWGRAACAPAEG